MARDKSQLHPWLQYKIMKLEKECKKQGLALGISECFRSKEEQDALYAQGRTKPGKIVTNAPGSSYSSQHQWGVAFDVFQNIKGKEYQDSFFPKVAKIAKKLGLGWGGDWKSIVDTPHFYLKKWGSTPTALKQQYGIFPVFKETWTGKIIKTAALRKGKTVGSKKIMTLNKGDKVDLLWKSKIQGVAFVKAYGKYGYVRFGKIR